MNRYTPRGLAISTRSDAAVAAIHRFEETVLDYGCDGAAILEAVAADPDCAVASALAATAQLFKSTRDGVEAARPLVAAALAGRADTGSEAMLIRAVAAWADGDLESARDHLRNLVGAYPRHLFAAKLLHYLQLAIGDVTGMLRTANAIIVHHPRDARAHAMHAFALDQNGRHEAAERAAHRALAIAPDPWAHHAVAHAMDATHRFAEGRRWMYANADSWSRCSSFLFTHNWWHAALFHIATGDHDGALGLFDQHVWTRRRDYAQDQINAISLLARLELAGVGVGDRWEDIVARVTPRSTDAVDTFLDVHYAYALARAGDDSAIGNLLAALDAAALDSWSPRRLATASAAAGIAAAARGRPADAARLLGAAEPHFHSIGGSSVQRQLLTMTLAAARRGKADATQLKLAA